jgi:hypothetical protein
MAIAKQPDEQSSSASGSGGEINQDGGRKGEQKIPPLSLATPDLTPQEYRLIADTLEAERVKNHSAQVAADAQVIEKNRELFRAQIDRMFTEDARLRQAVVFLPQDMTPVPIVAISREAVVWRLRASIQSAGLYLRWLNDIIPDSAIAALFGTGQMSQRAAELYRRLKYLWRFYSIQQNDLARNDRINALVNLIFLKIDLLRELDVLERQLSANAFEIWLQSEQRDP